MRRATGQALFIAVSLALCGPATAQTAIGGLALDLTAESRDLEFPTKDLVFQIEDLSGGVRDLDVKETETEIRIELAADVLFDFDSAELRAGAEQALGRVAGIIRSHQGAGVRVEGHTDAKGSDGYNRKLSRRRAEAVRDWLLDAEGLSGTKFKSTGFGEI